MKKKENYYLLFIIELKCINLISFIYKYIFETERA